MTMLQDFDEEAVNARINYIARLLPPHMEKINPLIENYRSILVNVPQHLSQWHPDDLREAHEKPGKFLSGFLMDVLFKIAIAEQQTGVTFPDQGIPEKVISDIKAEIVEIAELERSASSGLTH
jgi:hypothetical protein